MPADVVGYLYAATVAAGGIFGYVKAASIPSLGAGLAFGGILGYGAYQNSQEPPKPLVALGTSLLLAGMMGFRWSKSGKFMPPGMICVISVAAFVRNLVAYNQHIHLPGRSQW